MMSHEEKFRAMMRATRMTVATNVAPAAPEVSEPKPAFRIDSEDAANWYLAQTRESWKARSSAFNPSMPPLIVATTRQRTRIRVALSSTKAESSGMDVRRELAKKVEVAAKVPHALAGNRLLPNGSGRNEDQRPRRGPCLCRFCASCRRRDAPDSGRRKIPSCRHRSPESRRSHARHRTDAGKGSVQRKIRQIVRRYCEDARRKTFSERLLLTVYNEIFFAIDSAISRYLLIFQHSGRRVRFRDAALDDIDLLLADVDLNGGNLQPPHDRQ